jgi:hypothetical protein
MKPSYTLLAMIFTLGAAAQAQVAPATAGPAGFPVGGTLRYDLRYTQTAQFYDGPQGNSQSSVVSGDLAYANSSRKRPFTLTYSGGDMWNITGGSGETGVFQHLFVSQGIVGRKWTLNFSDNIGYMPQAPTTGFSGIPGVGDLPSQPTQPVQPVLTLNTRSVDNTANANFSHSLGPSTSLSAGGSYEILRFPDGNGLEDNQWQVNGQITRRLNAHNSVFAQYAYSRSTYPDNTITTDTQSALFGYTRTWNRRFKTSVSMGPEWDKITGIETNLLGLIIPLPPSTSSGLTVNASASYEIKSMTATLGYFQGTSGGAGVLESFGTNNKDLSGGLSRQFGRNLTISASGAYMRTQALISGLALELGSAQPGGVTNGVYGGAGATRRLGRYITIFANYTATQQSSSSALPTNAISGLSQVIGFGIGYSPRQTHLRK